VVQRIQSEPERVPDDAGQPWHELKRCLGSRRRTSKSTQR
jgi:hypothetical protein